MKTFKKDYLPSVLRYKGEDLTLHPKQFASEYALKRELAVMKEQGRKYALVEVLAKNLVNRTDLHSSKPYEPNVFLFSSAEKQGAEFLYKDKSGRDFTATIIEANMEGQEAGENEDWNNGESLEDFVQTCDIGDEWENRVSKYTRIK